MPDDTLEAILGALGDDPAGGQAGRLPAMIVADPGQTIAAAHGHHSAEATGEDGRTVRLAHIGDGFAAPSAPGYYSLALGEETLELAVAPPRAPQIPRGVRHWGAAVQISALRGAAPFGTFGDLARACTTFASKGAASVAINPVHALFPGEGRDFSPYSPSSRLFLNGAMADPALAGLPPIPPAEGPPLIDWEGAMPARLAQLRAGFDALDPGTRARIARDPAMADATLVRHATFDALYARFAPAGARGWQDWPSAYRDPAGPAVARFVRENAEEIAFHLFVQWLAREGLIASQRAAREAGMDIGIIADLAVGVSTAGSDCWSLRDAMLGGLTVGAPPDPLGPQGQNWHLSTFSPAGLRRTGYAPFIAMLRSGFAAGGGLRVDHAFGLERLWVIPEGASATDGAYLSYPFRDLLRLLVLEAHRAGAIVVAENLGTSPYGFAEAIADRGLHGMEVLWFARAADAGFRGADDYRPTAVAMTGTHDTPTVAGWWSGRDLDWAERCGRLGPRTTRAEAESVREWDRGMLWSTIGGGLPRPAPEEPEPAVDAAIAHIARTPSSLAIVPLEDLLAEREQPNLPGTTDTHPNWRRRNHAALDTLLAAPAVAERTAVLSRRGG
ncbi:4-alpha-glucanotransferase [Tsuneonella sp. YG55]|uniref:4-alpha-glucanotransferase n=1 Tax=Tsuneonella litorea TaxID=2976475 RepID=A0A9X3AL95_9SPHN|nr:4-alpha-glucanotransferase [Tsuneonella litorea]MCT2558963.1 4-alpha-glucanotransferase [Tsuneonella litorea]